MYRFRIPSPKQIGQAVSRFLLNSVGLFAKYLFKRMVSLVLMVSIPTILLFVFSVVMLDSMYNWTGGQLNLPGRDMTFATEKGQEVKERYIEVADKWKENLTEEEINEVYDNKVDFNWSILAAMEKIEHNFDDFSKLHPEKSYELMEPIYHFKDSQIIITTSCNGKSSTTVHDVRLLTEAYIYSGDYKFIYEWVTEISGGGGCTVETTYEKLVKREEKIDYKRLIAAMEYYKIPSPNINYQFVIFQAYGFERNLHDPLIPYLFPPSMTGVELATPIEVEEPSLVDGPVPVEVPEEAELLEGEEIIMTPYDWKSREQADAPDRTDLGTLPRRGGNKNWGTAAISKDNPYGLKVGMKIYVPSYGYAIIEETERNVWDDVLQGENGFESFMIDIAKEISDAADIVWSLFQPDKSEVLYLYIKTTPKEEDALGIKANYDLNAAKFNLNKYTEPDFGTGPYGAQEIYMLPNDFEIEIPPAMEQPAGTFFNGDGWRITSGWLDSEGRPSQHTGVDFGTPRGTKVLALYDGTATAQSPLWSTGNYVTLQYDAPVYVDGREKRLVLRYLHLSKYAPNMPIGKPIKVKRGDLIGYTGNSGYWDESQTRAVGVHLHLDLSFLNPGDSLLAKNRGRKRNPLEFMHILQIATGRIDLHDSQDKPIGGDDK